MLVAIRVYAITAFDNGSYTGPFEYSLDGVNWQNNGNFTGLSPGTVTLQVKDNTGKIGFFEFVITNGCQLVDCHGHRRGLRTE